MTGFSDSKIDSRLAFAIFGVAGLLVGRLLSLKRAEKMKNAVSKDEAPPPKKGAEYAKKGGVKPINLVMTGITAGVCAVLALFAIIIVPIPGLPSGSGFWIPAGFYFTFTLWFGIWGALGGYISTFIAMGYFNGYTIVIFLDGATGDFLSPLIPLLAFRFLKADPGLRDTKSRLIWVVTVPISSLFTGMWVHTVNVIFQVISPELWIFGVIGYLIGDTLAVFIIGTPLLIGLTPLVERTPAYVKGIFY
ncbi:MAG: hypothetical protein ACTSW4_02960 [Candidatus Ranarchaeia archaeon]